MKSIRAYPLLLRQGYGVDPSASWDFQDKDYLFHWPPNIVENIFVWIQDFPDLRDAVPIIRRSHINEKS